MSLNDLRLLRIETQLKDPSYEFNGEIYMDPALTDWHPIEVVDVKDCRHLETMCNECGPSWLLDHWVRILHPSGAMLGINEVPGIPHLADLPEVEDEDE